MVLNVSVWKGDQPLDLRLNEVFEIPTQRVAELDVVFSASCSSDVTLSQDGTAVSTCMKGTTCSPTGADDGGQAPCVSDTVRANELPSFSGDAGASPSRIGTDADAGDATAVTPADGAWTPIPPRRRT